MGRHHLPSERCLQVGFLPRLGFKLTTRLLQAFARYLPDLRATFSIFDQPQIYLSWARRGSLVDLGLRNERECEKSPRPSL